MALCCLCALMTYLCVVPNLLVTVAAPFCVIRPAPNFVSLFLEQVFVSMSAPWEPNPPAAAGTPVASTNQGAQLSQPGSAQQLVSVKGTSGCPSQMPQWQSAVSTAANSQSSQPPAQSPSAVPFTSVGPKRPPAGHIPDMDYLLKSRSDVWLARHRCRQCKPQFMVRQTDGGFLCSRGCPAGPNQLEEGTPRPYTDDKELEAQIAFRVTNTVLDSILFNHFMCGKCLEPLKMTQVDGEPAVVCSGGCGICPIMLKPWAPVGTGGAASSSTPPQPAPTPQPPLMHTDAPLAGLPNHLTNAATASQTLDSHHVPLAAPTIEAAQVADPGPIHPLAPDLSAMGQPPKKQPPCPPRPTCARCGIATISTGERDICISCTSEDQRKAIALLEAQLRAAPSLSAPHASDPNTHPVGYSAIATPDSIKDAQTRNAVAAQLLDFRSATATFAQPHIAASQCAVCGTTMIQWGPTSYCPKCPDTSADPTSATTVQQGVTPTLTPYGCWSCGRPMIVRDSCLACPYCQTTPNEAGASASMPQNPACGSSPSAFLGPPTVEPPAPPPLAPTTTTTDAQSKTHPTQPVEPPCGAVANAPPAPKAAPVLNTDPTGHLPITYDGPRVRCACGETMAYQGALPICLYCSGIWTRSNSKGKKSNKQKTHNTTTTMTQAR